MAQLYNTTLTPSYTIANNNTTLSLALGTITIVLATVSQSLSFNGITAVGGNVDGMVLTFQNVTGSFQISFANDAGSPSTSGFLNTGLSTVTGGTGYGAIWYRYFASANRWLQIGRT